MFLLRAIPISKGIPKDSLSYFTSESIAPGSVIDIPLRGKKVPGLVLESKEVEMEKSEIKSLPFSLRKLTSTKASVLLSPKFIESIEMTAKYHATSLGGALEALTPKALYTERENLQTPIETKVDLPATEVLLFQADEETRFAHYKSLIREAFAYKRSFFICVPTVSEGARLFNYLEKGIEQYTYFVHGSLSKKEFIHIWNEVATGTHPILVIGTPIFLCLPRIWHTIIIEKESSHRYKMRERPFIDTRTFIEQFSKLNGTLCILSDNLVRLETLTRLENYEIQELSPIKWRSIVSAECTLIDMRLYNKDKKEFRLLSNEVKSLIEKTKRESSHLFLYTARRGIAPSIVCRDCGTTVICNKCSAPVVLHASAGRTENTQIKYFLCHTCGEKRDADELCKTCGSWNLIPLGIGIEGVEQEIKNTFPDIKIFRIDSDITPTPKKVQTTMQEFYETPGSILLGTDMALSALAEPVENTAIISLDSLFALPDFRIHEKILHIILRLRSLSTNSCIVQTRQADSPLWNDALKGNLIDFYRREVKERQTLQYPPFVTLIKISYTGTPALVREEMKKLKEYITPHEASIFPAFIETQKGKFVMHALIRIPKGSWPDNSLLEKIRSLPPGYAVDVDPEHLL